jgi:hypothetical protein
MDFLKTFDLTHWWNKLIAVGVPIIVAALAANERGLIFIALGVIAFGLGESINHRKEIEITPPNVYVPAAMITSYHRSMRPLGVVFDVAGLILIVVGFWKLLAA